jgi:hypothetical protein
MVRFIFPASSHLGRPPFDPLDKLAAIVTLIIIWRLLGGC